MNDDWAELIGDAALKDLRNVVPIGGAGHTGAAEFEHKPSLATVWQGGRHVILSREDRRFRRRQTIG
jgi:hypothetical protein